MRLVCVRPCGREHFHQSLPASQRCGNDKQKASTIGGGGPLGGQFACACAAVALQHLWVHSDGDMPVTFPPTSCQFGHVRRTEWQVKSPIGVPREQQPMGFQDVSLQEEGSTASLLACRTNCMQMKRTGGLVQLVLCFCGLH